MNVLKKGIIAFIFFVVLLLFSIEFYALFQVKKMGVAKKISHQQYSQVSKEILWVSLRERQEISLTSFLVSRYVMQFFITVLVVDYEKVNAGQDYLPVGSKLAMSVSSELLTKLDERGPNWQFKNLFVASWVSRNYSPNEALDYRLDTLYFGYHAYGLHDASKTYFSKTLEQLSLSEKVTLLAMSYAPSRFAGCKNTEGLEKRARDIMLQLKLYNAMKYKGEVYQLPVFSNC